MNHRVPLGVDLELQATFVEEPNRFDAGPGGADLGITAHLWGRLPLATCLIPPKAAPV